MFGNFLLTLLMKKWSLFVYLSKKIDICDLLLLGLCLHLIPPLKLILVFNNFIFIFLLGNFQKPTFMTSGYFLVLHEDYQSFDVRKITRIDGSLIIIPPPTQNPKPLVLWWWNFWKNEITSFFLNQISPYHAWIWLYDESFWIFLLGWC